MIHYFGYQFHASVIECAFEYEPAERGAREDGGQLEPDYPPSLTLIDAYLNQLDITELLSAEAICAMEAEALRGIDD